MGGIATQWLPEDFCPVFKHLAGKDQLGLPSDEAMIPFGIDDYGVDMKWFGATTGHYMLWDQSEDELVLYAPTFGENDNIIDIDVYPSSVSACSRQGAISLTMRRDTVMTSWDGNADIPLRVYSYNYAANGTSYCRIEGMEILARNRTGSCVSVTGAYITAENYNGSAGVVDVIGMEVHAKNNGVASGNVKVLRVFDESGSSTGTTYGIEIMTGDGAFAREYCIYINTHASATWTNGITFDGTITNVLDFADTDGTNGATYSSGHYATLGAIDGKIQVDLGGNTLYIPCYASIAA